jgi:hypothetical protein
MLRNSNGKIGNCFAGLLVLSCLPATKGIPAEPVRADPAKSAVIEPPALAVVRQKSTTPAVSGKAFVNARVLPGKVHWHATFADACQAAQKSRKPVLLFQMMGKLDDLFC